MSDAPLAVSIEEQATSIRLRWLTSHQWARQAQQHNPNSPILSGVIEDLPRYEAAAWTLRLLADLASVVGDPAVYSFLETTLEKARAKAATRAAEPADAQQPAEVSA